MAEKCKLKAGDFIYECNHHQAILSEVLTNPELHIQSDGSHFWCWAARIVETGRVLEYGVPEEGWLYTNLYRENAYAVGFDVAERIKPPFDTGAEVLVIDYMEEYRKREMKKETFKTWMAAHAGEVSQIRQAAHDLHASVNQTYDGDKPYGVHLDMVAESVERSGYMVCAHEEDVLPMVFGAYYHDSIEDARLTYNDVVRQARQWMDDEQATMAAEIVYALTNDKGRTRAERAGQRYYEGIRQTPYAPFMKLADRLANMRYSFGGSNSANRHMKEVYKQELDHFLQAITSASKDQRMALPSEMLYEIHRLTLSS